MTDEPGITTIERAKILELMAHGTVRLVEALGPAFFADAHLPGAVNIPPDRVEHLAASLLPDRDELVVVYCSGTCTNSESTARRLVALGYRDVRVYLGGKEDWIEAGLPVERDDATA